MNFTHKIGNENVSVRRLSVRELAILHEAADLWAADTPMFIKGSLANLWTYANSISGACAILEKSGLTESQIDAMERYDMATLALKACGFTIPETEADPAADRDGAPVRPTTEIPGGGIG